MPSRKGLPSSQIGPFDGSRLYLVFSFRTGSGGSSWSVRASGMKAGGGGAFQSTETKPPLRAARRVGPSESTCRCAGWRFLVLLLVSGGERGRKVLVELDASLEEEADEKSMSAEGMRPSTVSEGRSNGREEEVARLLVEDV